MESDFSELTLKNLSAGYDKRQVLQNINLDLKMGEIAAVVGKNGAGKSTLIKTVVGLVKASKGTIIYHNKDITNNDIKDRIDSGIYFFMQGGQIFPSLTVQENLTLASHTLQKKDREQRISDLFPLIFPGKLRSTEKHSNGSHSFLNQIASRLSGGEKHKLALMMVLINYPPLLLLDEPSAGLSPKSATSLYEVISDFVSRFQTTVLLIEQNVKLAVENSERIFLLAQGKIIKDTMTSELKTHDGIVNLAKLDDFFFNL